jgi:hypothetical protein
MRRITPWTAALALVAAISTANAQDTASPATPGAMKSMTNQVSGSDKFCIKGAGGALNCRYASLPDCEKAAKSGESCQLRPSSTTGSGAMAK